VVFELRRFHRASLPRSWPAAEPLHSHRSCSLALRGRLGVPYLETALRLMHKSRGTGVMENRPPRKREICCGATVPLCTVWRRRIPLGGAASMEMAAAAPACGLEPGLVLCRCAEGAGVTGPAGVACRDERERFAQRPRQLQQNQAHSPRKTATSQSRVADTVHISSCEQDRHQWAISQIRCTNQHVDYSSCSMLPHNFIPDGLVGMFSGFN
jgi:hypothetical protein